jgi:hypothetical protein
MKFQKVIFAFITIFILHFIGNNSFAISHVTTVNSVSADEKHLSAKDQQMVAQMRIFVNMTVEQYGKLRGKKLNFFERLSFRASQRRMRLMLKAYDDGDGPTTLQKISWLLKGLLFGPIALIVGYIFLKDDERELIKWIWFGFIGFAAIAAIIIFSY